MVGTGFGGEELRHVRFGDPVFLPSEKKAASTVDVSSFSLSELSLSHCFPIISHSTPSTKLPNWVEKGIKKKGRKKYPSFRSRLSTLSRHPNPTNQIHLHISQLSTLAFATKLSRALQAKAKPPSPVVLRQDDPGIQNHLAPRLDTQACASSSASPLSSGSTSSSSLDRSGFG